MDKTTETQEDDILNFLIANDMINLDDVQQQMNLSKKKILLKTRIPIKFGKEVTVDGIFIFRMKQDQKDVGKLLKVLYR